MLISSLFRKMSFPSLIGKCVPQAIYIGETYTEAGYEVQFVVREIKKGYDHIQAQVKYNGEWVYMCQFGKWCDKCKPEFPNARIKKIISWRQLLSERIRADVRASR